MPSRTLLNEDDTDAVVPCPCGTDWWDEWVCLCNDRCPTCDAEIEPDGHEAIQGTKSAKIRTPNDRFRKSLTGGPVMMTAAVSALPNDVRARTIELTRTFDDFTPDDDPHNEHNFGSFEIDDQSMQYGSEDPGDSKKQHASSRSCSRTNTEDAIFLWSLVVNLSG